MALDIWNRYVESAATQYGVPPALVSSVIGAESSWRPGVEGPVTRSGQRAGGMMQLMPDTFAELRQKHGLGPDRFDPQTNIQAGTAYLGQLYKQFGNWPDAIAAYNAGPGRWAQVKAGKADAPRETTDYVAKVTAGFQGQGDAAPAPLPTVDVGRNMYAGPVRNGGGDMTGPRLMRPQPGQTVTPRSGSLLDVDETNNWLDGLGGLLGEGQTASQPPGPSISPLQYQLAGAGNAVGQLAGVTNRRVGIGELLGALGGGLTQGAAAGLQAQRQQRADERAETGERFDNVYKAAMTRKALMPERMNLGDRFKVAGKRIFDAATQTWIDDPNAGADQGGPLDGTGIDAQMNNAYIVLTEKVRNGQQLTPQEQLLHGMAERHLMKPRVVAGPDGVVREVAPAPLPTLPNAGGTAPPVTAPPAAVPPPGPDLLDTQRTPPAAPPPSPTVTPSGSRVTDIVPPRAKEIPATAQTGILENVNALRSVENAITATTKAPEATGVLPGLLNELPFGVVNKTMPGGTEARAAIADIGSLKIHDRSGAAVTVSEFPRLAPFVPLVSDDDATVQVKLKRFREELANEIRDQAAMYGADQGYKGNPILQDFLKTGRAPRYEAPMEGGGGGTSALSDDEIKRKLGL